MQPRSYSQSVQCLSCTLVLPHLFLCCKTGVHSRNIPWVSSFIQRGASSYPKPTPISQESQAHQHVSTRTLSSQLITIGYTRVFFNKLQFHTQNEWHFVLFNFLFTFFLLNYGFKRFRRLIDFISRIVFLSRSGSTIRGVWEICEGSFGCHSD